MSAGKPLRLTDEKIAEVRLEILKFMLWQGATHVALSDPERVAQSARVLADFVLGTGDADLHDAAREFIDRVSRRERPDA